jgi:UDP-N-acetylglucosamine 4,6-dehydratase
MEKVMVSKSRNLNDNKTIFCGTRYGNVMASRGSVIPLFAEQVRAGRPITITDPKMTRFMMSLEDAVDLVLYAFRNGKNGDIFVQKAPAASIETLTKALLRIMNLQDYDVRVIGTRHGEKLYETLLSREEMTAAQDLGDYYRILPDLRDLNYDKYTKDGVDVISHTEDYHSHNTTQLSVESMVLMLRKLPYIKALERGELLITTD